MIGTSEMKFFRHICPAVKVNKEFSVSQWQMTNLPNNLHTEKTAQSSSRNVFLIYFFPLTHPL